MNGSAFILHANGSIYATNDADMTTQRNLIKDKVTGAMTSKHTQVINVRNYFKASGQLAKDDEVHCQFMEDESGIVKTFLATITGFSDEMLILNLKALNLRNKEFTETIKNKIKEEISYGS